MSKEVNTIQVWTGAEHKAIVAEAERLSKEGPGKVTPSGLLMWLWRQYKASQSKEESPSQT